jgi:ABC-2 type transport system permease protein
VFLNPMVIVVLTFQRAIYNPDPGLLLETDKSIAWFAGMLAISGLVALCALVGALLVFGRLEDNLGEEI